MHNFTPLSALCGGILIGLSASAMLLLDGKIAGISGILPGVFAFGIIRPFPILIIAGLLVGFGTRVGSGCTSGHGVCGVSRLSPRSIVATATFIATGAIVVFIFNHVVSSGQ